MSNYDEFDFIADAGEVKDGVDSATDILDTSVENINLGITLSQQDY